MARIVIALFAAITAALLLVFALLHRPEPPPAKSAPEAARQTTYDRPGSAKKASTDSLPGDALLAEYATEKSTPKRDLDSIARVMDSFSLLAKPSGGYPLADNQDWSAALKGKSGYRDPFVSEGHRVFNPQGRLADRWGSALFFHPLGGGRYEIRSAGPDKKLWTGDDIQRNADGSFLQATNLNPASLWKR